MSVQPNKARLMRLLETLTKNVDIGGECRLGMGGGHLNTVVLSGGGTTTLTAANSGATCIFDTAATSNFTLPAPELGMRFTFLSVITATGDHAATDGNNDFITMNGSTTGGIAGSFLHVVAILDSTAAKCWAVHGNIIGTGNTITPFGDAQI